MAATVRTGAAGAGGGGNRRQRQAVALREIGLHDVLGDGGAEVAVLRMLDEHHARHFGIVLGRHEHEPAVIVQVAVGLAAGTLFTLVRNHLRRAGLAGHVAAGDAPAAGSAGAVDRQPQAIAHRGDRFRLHHERHKRRRRMLHCLPALSLVVGLDDARDDARAAIGHRRHHHRHRHRRDRQLALADGHRDGFTRIPPLARSLQLPFGRRDNAFLLVGEIDAALQRQSQLLGPLVHLVDAEHVADGVEVGIARLLDRVPQVDVAVAPDEVALEESSVERAAAGAIDRALRRDQSLFERPRRDHDLEGRSRLIASLYRAVLKRPQLVGIELLPGGAIDAGRKIIRIECRKARQRQHFTGLRLEHHGRSPIAIGAERILRSLLHRVVDRQLDAAALLRRHFLELADFAAHAVDHDAARAVFAHQQLVVDALDAELADDRSGGHIVGGHLLFVRFADVADQVRGHRLVGIFARRHFLHDHVGQLEIQPSSGDRRDLGQRGIGNHHDRPVARLAPIALDDLANGFVVGAGHRRQHANGAVDVLGVLAHDRDVERIAVLDQQAAGTVEDHAAGRPQGQRALVVVLRHFLELGELHHLEEPEPAGQEAESDTDPDPQAIEASRKPPAIFGNCHKRNYRLKKRPARRRSTNPGNHSIIWNPITPTKAFPNACPTITG